MTSPKFKWSPFLSTLLFLVLVMMQPIHQLGHLADHHGHDCHKKSHSELRFSVENQCDLCDFHFANPTEISFQDFDFEVPTKEFHLEISSIFPTPISTENFGAFFLRGPPKMA